MFLTLFNGSIEGISVLHSVTSSVPTITFTMINGKLKITGGVVVIFGGMALFWYEGISIISVLFVFMGLVLLLSSIKNIKKKK